MTTGEMTMAPMGARHRTVHPGNHWRAAPWFVAALLLAAAAPAAEWSSLFGFDTAQTPTWSAEDTSFFLYGSMSTEVAPEAVLAAFAKTYPDLFPPGGLAAFGAIDDGRGGLPIGFSRRDVPHLGGLSAIGINCAACHTAEFVFDGRREPLRVLGPGGNFEPEAFFGVLIAATFRTTDADSMRGFLANYAAALDPKASAADVAKFAAILEREKAAIAAAVAADALGTRDMPAGGLHELNPVDLRIALTTTDPQRIAATARALLKLLHNMRFALHVPDRIPDAAPPRSGPGRNDAFGTLSPALFGVPTSAYAPVKFGVAWELAGRSWVHWDGNTRDPIVRNLAASLGLGAPLSSGKALLRYVDLRRHTDLSEKIRAPKYPLPIDAELAGRGEKLYAANCASCHDGPRDDRRLYDPVELGVDANRARIFDANQAALYNRFLGELKVDGYSPSSQPAVRTTGKYWSPDLAGVWARSPYLHNGSVRTIEELLMPASQRPRAFLRGTRRYDERAMGLADEGNFRFETTAPGNSNAGHEYGTSLSDDERRALIEHLKTR